MWSKKFEKEQNLHSKVRWEHYLSFVWWLKNVFFWVCRFVLLRFFTYFWQRCRKNVQYFLPLASINVRFQSKNISDCVLYVEVLTNINNSCPCGPFFHLCLMGPHVKSFFFIVDRQTKLLCHCRLHFISSAPNIFHAIQLSSQVASPFIPQPLNPYHRKTLQFEFCVKLWKLNGWLHFMSCVIW